MLLDRKVYFQAGATTSTSRTDDKIGWDSHKAVESIPDTLVRVIDGNDSMRRKFEELCRSAQVRQNLLNSSKISTNEIISVQNL